MYLFKCIHLFYPIHIEKLNQENLICIHDSLIMNGSVICRVLIKRYKLRLIKGYSFKGNTTVALQYGTVKSLLNEIHC